jgi:hypothetical protein
MANDCIPFKRLIHEYFRKALIIYKKNSSPEDSKYKILQQFEQQFLLRTGRGFRFNENMFMIKKE